MISGKKRFLIVLLLVVASAFATEKLDGIVAVIGDSIILASELDAYVFLKTSQSGQKPDMLALNVLRQESLDELIDGKVLIVKAEKDTNITVTSSEVNSELEGRIQFILNQNNLNMDQFEEVLKNQQGLGLIKFKSELREQIRLELIKQKVQQLYAAPGEISRSDVESFFEEYKDSLPPAGESVLLSKLVIENTASTAVRESAYKKITAIKERLDNGENFAEVAKTFSQGPNAANGGDLGFIAKGSLSLLAFEERAFRMKPGETSEPFETKLGFHILKCLARKDQMVHIRQIFVEVTPPEEQVAGNEALVDSIATNATSEQDFTSAVEKFSTDEVSKSRKGLLSWQELSRLDPAVRDAVEDLDVGEVSGPVKRENTISLFRLVDRKESRPLSLEEDWNEIATLAQRVLSQKRLRDLVKKWREDVHIDLRL